MKRWYATPALALAALVAAVVAAVGPAVHERARYSWPPPEITPVQPEQTWYTPLLLVSRVPESIDVTIPCERLVTLGSVGRPSTVLATARDPRSVDGLQVTVGRDSLNIAVGSRQLTSVPWPPSRGSCPFSLRVTDGELELPDRTVALRTSYPGQMPSVSALFSELDLRRTAGFGVVVATTTYATTPTTKQNVAATASALLAVAALLIVLSVFGQPRELARGLRASLGRSARSADRSDAVVVLFLVLWLVLSPANVDDGYVWVRQRTFADIGTFTNYFDSYGASLPLYYWLEWLQHWVTSRTDDIAFQRLPTLVALLGSWVVARWCCRQTVAQSESSIVRWTLAAVFVLSAAAWNMTLRPEPFVSLLVGICLACAIAFASAPRLWPLALALLAATLALTAHPEGVAALAPLMVVSPWILGWLRGSRDRAVAVTSAALSAMAVGVVLVFLDSDIETWSSNRELLGATQTYAETPWWLEVARYVKLVDVSWWATPIRLASVAVLLLVVVAYLTRRRKASEPPLLALPAQSLTLALMLLVFDPSKNAFHFGALAVLGAVAAAAECARFRDEAAPRRLPVRPVLAIGLVTLAFVTSLSADGFWNPLDLGTRTWLDPTVLGLDVFDPRPWLLVAALALGGALVAHRRARRARSTAGSNTPWVVAAWSVPAASAALVALTGAVMVADTIAADWTLPRQNLAAIAGSDGCGLADSVSIVPGVDSSSGNSTLAAAVQRDGVRTLLEPATAPYFPCADTPAFDQGVVEVPDLIVGWELEPWPVVIRASPFRGIGDLYPPRLIYHDGADLTVHEVRADVSGAVLLPITITGR
ncbi:MAG: arabinosyltransferase domain-containing protein [Gaiellaceae bacterium]